MSSELYYASAPRGLKPGSRGFCTVARTDGMTAAVVERLESLSSYQPVFAGGSATADLNPVGFSHWRIPVGTRSRSVLSRVAFVPADYTGRPGKFAYHLVLDPAEQHPAGPAWMMMQPDVMRVEWGENPKLLPPRAMKKNDAQPDAIEVPDWSRQLAESYANDAARPAYVIYDAGAEMLYGMNAAIGLLPPVVRWQVTFNTHFTELPAGLTCAWRCVVAGMPAGDAAAQSKTKALVINLSQDPDAGAES
jgi:hypothetical protein